MLSRGPREQRTLRGAIAWSWTLLAPPERAALAQLSVFRGGFDLAAAEAVIEAGAPALDLVDALRNRSLLHIRPAPDDGGALRFGLYVSIREFAAVELGATDELRVAARHAEYFANLVEREGNPARLVDERENLLGAIDRSLATGTRRRSRSRRGCWSACSSSSIGCRSSRTSSASKASSRRARRATSIRGCASASRARRALPAPAQPRPGREPAVHRGARGGARDRRCVERGLPAQRARHALVHREPDRRGARAVGDLDRALPHARRRRPPRLHARARGHRAARGRRAAARARAPARRARFPCTACRTTRSACSR